MTLTPNLMIGVAFGFVATLFIIAFWAERQTKRGRLRWLNSSAVYTLSLSVYCTSWTFYGAVGTAARSGLEYATIYLGPTLVFVGWALLMQKLVRVGRAQRATSIADFLSARYGKSPSLAALASIIAVVAILPYIALQLKAVASSFHLIASANDGAWTAPDVDGAVYRTALWLAIGMALFTILFGTRNVDANERHHGVVAAIAFEAVVKLTALVAVGLFAVYGVSGGVTELFASAPSDLVEVGEIFDARWAALTFLSAAAIICLPRQFQVAVVECVDERHGRVASWAFPAYLLLISLFVLPIVIVGQARLPDGADPDFFVLTLPLSMGEEELTLLAFLGGFSSATSMVIVSCIALSTMVSNHLLMPILLKLRNAPVSGDVRRFLLAVRRVSICAILFLGFVYFRVSGSSEGLAAIGLISFAGVAQFLPGLVAALYWRRATGLGAGAGLFGGFAVWSATLFGPSLLNYDLAAVAAWTGLEALSPITGGDPLVHALILSMSTNLALLIGFSLAREASPLGRVQSMLFVEARPPLGDGDAGVIRRTATTSDLYILAQRILGGEKAYQLFEEFRRRQGLASGLPVADDALISQLEERLAGSVGAASARAMIVEITTGEVISLEALMKIADENAKLLHYSQQLEQKSAELEVAAERLREANDRLQEIDAQKDDFLSQISHELRTPMTSLRAFSEILHDAGELSEAERQRFARIIHNESLRLTRLLDQILDLAQLERREMEINPTDIALGEVIERSIEACAPLARDATLDITRQGVATAPLLNADPDRLQQVFMNVISNALKVNQAAPVKLWIRVAADPDHVDVFVSDDGVGVRLEDRERIFSKFARGSPTGEKRRQGVGLGLAICRQIMKLHGGSIAVVDGEHGGATFRIRLAWAVAERRGAVSATAAQ